MELHIAGESRPKKEDLSFVAKQDDQGRWVVYESKNETWLYGELYFEWDESAKCWFLTGFKYEMDEPGDCI